MTPQALIPQQCPRCSASGPHQRGPEAGPHYQRLGRSRHWFRLLQINLCSAFKQLFVSKISPGGRSSLLTLLKPLQELDEL
jgi:hypothetical protein